MSVSERFFITGGTLPLQAASYIERAADKELLSALRSGDYAFLLNARQMGKSSLAVRVIAQLSDQGIRTVFLDLQKFGGANVTPDQWYVSLLSEIGRTLACRRELLAYWQANGSYTLVHRFFEALREVVLESLTSPLVMLLDEIDTVRSLPFSTDEFFAGIRECYNARVHNPVYDRLTFCLVGSALGSHPGPQDFAV
ncbi:MAG: AAA-like domain-containing protein [Armatimonadetes bacterium]|nr:AAA-like domain-containing protein [Armatimonadota bacterium]